MALNLARKKEIVADISGRAEDAVSIVLADYRKLTSNEMNDFRSKAREASVQVKVVRNTLARRAFEGTDYEGFKERLVGPLLMAISTDAPSAPARLIKDFAKDHDQLEVVALAVGASVYGADQLESVASLPTKDEAISKLLSCMKAPIGKFVRTLAAPHEKLVRTVAAVRDQKKDAA